MNVPKRVFLIDDDEEEHDILMTALNQCCNGVQLKYENDCKTAIDILSVAGNNLLDIVFLDWRMPKVSGQEALVIIRTLPHMQNVPIVIFTGHTDPYALETALILGASYFIYKPFNVKELVVKLEQLFSIDWKKFQFLGRVF